MDLRLSLASAALAAAIAPAALPVSPASWPTYCAGPPPALAPPLNHGMLFSPDDHTDLSLDTPGLPDEISAPPSAANEIAAGSGWHDFQLTASLPLQGVNSDLTGAPHDMKWIVFVSNGPEKGSPNDLPGSSVQYLNGAAWSGLEQWDGASTRLVTTPFVIDNGSQTATASLQLRFNIGAGAPRGPAYVVEFGTYVDSEQACTHYTFDANMITVGAPGPAPGSSRSAQYLAAGVIIIAAGSAAALAARRRRRSAR
ncbi:MAG: hypothetical protein ACRDN0_29020 [Trebonia sp.]